MTENMRIAVEIGFNIIYLIVVWAITIMMTWRLNHVVAENRKMASLFRWAFVLLALGDTGHVGFRIVAYILGGLEKNGLLVGVGALATAITVTFFYVILLFIWRLRFNKKFGVFEYVILFSVPVRMIVMCLPQNDWGNSVPPAFWGIFRNLFLVILGVGVLFLYLRDAKIAGDRLFNNIGICIFLSFLFYTPVILFARTFPLIGMLMIPKTIKYLVNQVLAYRTLRVSNKA
ncbi:MAG: hypothetical protein WCP85_17485 [Mariniphaga sp.]